MERETGLQPLNPNFAVALGPIFQDALDHALARFAASAQPAVEPALTWSEVSDMGLADLRTPLFGTALGGAVATVLARGAAGSDLYRRRWGLAILLRWAFAENVDLGGIDEVTLRERYTPYLLGRYRQANQQMWVAHRLLEVIDEMRATPGTFPPLPALPPKAPKASRVRKARGTDLVHQLDPGTQLAQAVQSVIRSAPSRPQVKLRRYAMGVLLGWCRETGRDPTTLTFDEIDGSFLPLVRERLRNATEIGVHARRLVREIANTRERGADARDAASRNGESPNEHLLRGTQGRTS